MRLCYVDTSNFKDKPVGGQLTSVRSQIEYFRLQPDVTLCLVGISHPVNNGSASGHVPGEPGADWIDEIPFVTVHTDASDPDYPAKSLRIAFMKGLLRNRKAITALKPDLFFIHCPEAFFPLKLLFPGKPIVTFMHGSFFDMYEQVRFFRMKKAWVRIALNGYLKWVIRKSSGLFVLDGASLDKALPLNRNVWKVTNSIDLERFSPSADLSRVQRAIFVGRLSANKRIDRIIEAIAGLPEISLDVVGEGEEFRFLTDLIASLGCQEQVRLLGSIPTGSIPRLLPKYDVLLMNSIHEGMPMVILEAMASGLAIISTKAGAIGEMIVEGENGLFTDGTADGIRKAMRRLAGMETWTIRANNLKKIQLYSHLIVNKEILRHLRAIMYGDSPRSM